MKKNSQQTVLLIDNYDSFVYNLARYVGELGYPRIVKRNDAITTEQIKKLNPSHIIISPGPCTPDKAGISLKVVKTFAADMPILGVCLGHQAIAQVFGAAIIKAQNPLHGKTSLIHHNNSYIFTDIANPLQAARYHSLIVSNNKFPPCLQIDAWSAEQEIMALSHKKYPLFGLQFHPESILTAKKYGYKLLKNFLLVNAS